MNLIYLGKQLKGIRKRTSKSLADVSNAIHIDRTFLSKIENGSRRPSIDILNQLLNYYSLNVTEYSQFYDLAGYPSVTQVPITSEHENKNEIFIRKGVANLVNQNEDINGIQQASQINVPQNLPVLYSDSIYVTSSPFGLVFDFAQRVGPTANQTVVSRVGVSVEHAKALLDVLSKKIIEAQRLIEEKEKSKSKAKNN